MGSIDLEVFPRVLDILSVPVSHDQERSADPGVDLRADCGPDRAREQKRPRLVGVKPCIKDALWRRADLTAEAHAGGTECRAQGMVDCARELHVTISLLEKDDV